MNQLDLVAVVQGLDAVIVPLFWVAIFIEGILVKSLRFLDLNWQLPLKVFSQHHQITRKPREKRLL